VEQVYSRAVEWAVVFSMLKEVEPAVEYFFVSEVATEEDVAFPRPKEIGEGGSKYIFLELLQNKIIVLFPS
jgi:hypothetical protein